MCVCMCVCVLFFRYFVRYLSIFDFSMVVFFIVHVCV